MAPSGAIHPLGSAFLTIRPPTRAFYDEDDTGKGSSGNGVLLKAADPVIRRVTTRPQPGNRCGYVAALPLHDGWAPREVLAHNASRLLRPGWSTPAPRITRSARGTGPLGPHSAPAPSRRARLLRPQRLQRPAPPKPPTACYTDTLLWARTVGAPGAPPRRRRGRTEHRPREILGFKTPVQTLEELFSDPSKSLAVAFTA
jgi:hypothetical protein